MIHRYKLNGFNIVIDVASGSIHNVDELAYDVICMYESENADTITARITEKYGGGISQDEISELLRDIADLKRRGKLFSSDPFADSAASGAKNAPLKALCMNVSHLCNMTCGYCFAGSGEYGGGGLMPLETGKRAIDFLVENSGARKNLDVDFFGGEPLLNWSVVKEIVKYARKIEQGSGKQFRFTLTTNGRLIDDDVIEFANRQMHNVVLSLDGRPEVNDAMRKLPEGGSSYAEVLPKFKKLVSARGNRGYYIRGTFTRDNTDFVRDVLHLADLGFTELSMEPVVAAESSPHALTMSDLPKLCEQYQQLAAEMLRRADSESGFTFYHYMLDLTGGPCIHKRLAGCGVGTEYLAVTPLGELYPCHQFAGDEKFKMGDVWSGVVNRELLDEFADRSIYSQPECKDCWARLYCSGGCAANAYHASGSISGVYELGCEMFKKRVECAVMMKVAQYKRGVVTDV